MKQEDRQIFAHTGRMRGAVVVLYFLALLAFLAITDRLLPHRLLLILLVAALETVRRRFAPRDWIAVLTAGTACTIAVLDPGLIGLALVAPLALAGGAAYRALAGISLAFALILLPAAATMSFSAGKDGILLLLVLLLAASEYFLSSLGETRKTILGMQDEISRMQHENSEQGLAIERSQLAQAGRIELTERNRIARRIHDALGHGLTGALWQLRAADQQLQTDVSAARDSLLRATDAVENGLAAIRSTIQDLQPRDVPDLAAIKQLVKDFGFCPLELEFEGDPEKIPGSVLSVFCDNIRELLTNTMRHSQASRVLLRLSHTRNFYRLEYRDNGIGMTDFNPGTSGRVSRSGMGLKGIRQRSQAIGGSCSFGTAADAGFVCVCLVSRRQQAPQAQQQAPQTQQQAPQTKGENNESAQNPPGR